MDQPSTPQGNHQISSIFGGPSSDHPYQPNPLLPAATGPFTSTSLSTAGSGTATLPTHGLELVPTPASAASSNNTYIMPNSPVKNRPMSDGYRPRVIRTLGQLPACLVNASVTYCGNNQIYVFGGFDDYTDEVYNHVLRLDLVSHQWSLVDNYGDIPGVRMGHTATLCQGDKLLVFGGENEHRAHLSDLIIFDLKTAHWTQPQVSGPIPKGRYRHAAVLHEDKLFIVGGMTGHDSEVLDDICYLDLKTFTWSRSWRFVGRFDHSAYIWDNRVFVFGGMSDDVEKLGDLWWLDLKGSPAFESPPQIGRFDGHTMTTRSGGSPRPYAYGQSSVVGSSGYAANSRTAQINPPAYRNSTLRAPGTVSHLKFLSGPNVPIQNTGLHYHAWFSGTLLDFQTPAAPSSQRECSLSALDLATFRWQQLAEGREIYKQGYRWRYCTINEDGTKAWLLGCPTDPASTELGPNGFEEVLSDLMEVDLRRYGFLGSNSTEPRSDLVRSASAARQTIEATSKGLGADLARLFNQPPETGSGTDFVITAFSGDWEDDEALSSGLIRATDMEPNHSWGGGEGTSPPIHVHKLILQARWPHFARLYNSQMAEFHTKKMHIPEPYSVVKAFLFYLYTDSIQTEDGGPADLSDVAGILVMSNIYNIPHLRHLCVNRLIKDLDVDHACITWHCAVLANEEWLRKRAASFCLQHWGRIVRTQGFLRLPRDALVSLSQEIDMEGRVIGGDELDMQMASSGFELARKASISSQNTQQLESEADDDDGMELN